MLWRDRRKLQMLRRDRRLDQQTEEWKGEEINRLSIGQIGQKEGEFREKVKDLMKDLYTVLTLKTT